MGAEIAIGFIALFFAVSTQIVIFTYGYGKLSQKVVDIKEIATDNRDRIVRVEKALITSTPDGKEIAKLLQELVNQGRKK